MRTRSTSSVLLTTEQVHVCLGHLGRFSAAALSSLVHRLSVFPGVPTRAGTGEGAEDPFSWAQPRRLSGPFGLLSHAPCCLVLGPWLVKGQKQPGSVRRLHFHSSLSLWGQEFLGCPCGKVEAVWQLVWGLVHKLVTQASLLLIKDHLPAAPSASTLRVQLPHPPS